MTFRRTLFWTLKVLLTFGFLTAGLSKFSPRSGWVERFAGWGYAPWFVTVIAVLEVLGVAGLWMPRLERYAIGLLALIMLGAVYTNATHPPVAALVRPLAFLFLLAGLVWLRSREAVQTRPSGE
jgi:uncharacterized membrane protein YphA (DoxX/SURF4 family)